MEGGQIIGMLIALAIGIAVGNDASKRGMNAFWWGFGVFMLLIIFLPLYFILRKPKTTPPQEDKTTPPQKDQAGDKPTPQKGE
jgi:hypothetical protein